jgi:RNase P/RNase MRP subunit p30
MINTDNIEKAKRMIKASVDEPIIVMAQDDNFNRKMLEYGRFNILVGVERNGRKDSLRQSDSGFNHVLSSIAARNNIVIGVDMDEILSLNRIEKSKRIARIMQNVKICRKAGTRIKLINFKDKKDAFSFLVSIGASTAQASEAISF